MPPLVFCLDEDSPLLIGCLILALFQLLDIFIAKSGFHDDWGRIIRLQVSVPAQSLQQGVLVHFADRSLVNPGFRDADSLQLGLVDLLELVDDLCASHSFIILLLLHF